MSDTQKTNGGRPMKVPEFLREPIEAAQTRLGHIEEGAQRVLKDVMDRGRASRKDLEDMVHRLSRQDWSEMRQRLERLRDQGVERATERATELRGRAETLRAEALERLVDLQGRAIAFLGVATREQMEDLSRELDRLAKRIDKGTRARRARKAARGAPAEV